MDTDQNSELQPIACTLSGSDQGQRVGEWQKLLAHGTAREPVPDGIRVTLPAGLAGPAAEAAPLLTALTDDFAPTASSYPA
jgi:hypothetical protein